MKSPNLEFILAWGLIGFFSLWGGVTRYLIDFRDNRESWNWARACVQVAISGFTGVLGGLMSFEAGSSYNLTFIMAGLSGAMGNISLKFLVNKTFK